MNSVVVFVVGFVFGGGWGVREYRFCTSFAVLLEGGNLTAHYFCINNESCILCVCVFWGVFFLLCFVSFVPVLVFCYFLSR